MTPCDFPDWQDPLGRYGDSHPVVRIHEWCSASWSPSSCGGPGSNLPHDLDPRGAGGIANSQRFWAENTIIQTHVPVYQQGYGYCYGNKCCCLTDSASKRTSQSPNLPDGCLFKSKDWYIPDVTFFLWFTTQYKFQTKLNSFRLICI